jgi:putative toxin-antitoxin system antitoxin component (TIGR02293 family)
MSKNTNAGPSKKRAATKSPQIPKPPAKKAATKKVVRVYQMARKKVAAKKTSGQGSFRISDAIGRTHVRMIRIEGDRLKNEAKAGGFAEALARVLNQAGLRRGYDQQDMLRSLRDGVTLEVVDTLKAWVPTRVLSNAIAPPSTISRWRRQEKELSGAAASGALRLVGIIALAADTFGDAEKSARWLSKPKHMLDPGMPNASPIEVAESEQGARLVEERLLQIAHGIFA